MSQINDLLFSIIIPAHNAELYLERCVDSVVEQSYEKKEIIIVENGSTDSTYNVASHLAEKYKIIKIVTTQESGVSNARNLGLLEASGEVIGFCDADDYYMPGILDNVFNNFILTGADLVVCGIHKISTEGETDDACYEESGKVWNGEKFITKVLLDDRVMGSVWNKFFKRDLIKNRIQDTLKCKFDTQLMLCEDTHFNVQVVKLNDGITISYTDYIGYAYNVNVPSSATNSVERMFKTHKSNYILAYELIEKDFILTPTEKKCVDSKMAWFSQAMIRLLCENSQINGFKIKYKLLKKTLILNLKSYIFCSEIPRRTRLKFIFSCGLNMPIYFMRRVMK